MIDLVLMEFLPGIAWVGRYINNKEEIEIYTAGAPYKEALQQLLTITGILQRGYSIMPVARLKTKDTQIKH